MPALADTKNENVKKEHEQIGSFDVSLDFFEGPMDLLLHLVRQHEVSIEEIEMNVIAKQYLEIVLNEQSLDLDKASEYLVITATLLAIKSQSLLPTEVIDGDLTDEQANDPDFLEELRRRLIAYELTKKRAETLASMPQHGIKTFSRKDRSVIKPVLEGMGEGEDPHSLGEYFVGLLKRIGSKVSDYKIQMESVSVVSYMMKIVDHFTDSVSNLINMEKRTTFINIVKMFSDKKLATASEGGHRGVIIGGFIATLELVKRGLLAADQNYDSGQIELYPKVEDTKEAIEKAQIVSEFDTPVEHDASDLKGDQGSLKSNVVPISDYQREKRVKLEPTLLEEDDESEEEVNKVG